MHTLPQLLFKMSTRVVCFAVCTAFFFLFLIIYNPFHLDVLLDMGRGLYTFNVSIMTAIVLVLLSGTGTALHFFKNARKFTWAHYILWSIGEVMLVAAFIAMYLCLMMRGEVPYFTVLLRSVGMCYAVFLFPYVILALSYDIAAMHIRAREKKNAPAEDESLMRFYDEQKRVKLIIAQSAVLYINADENYVNIFYVEGAKTVKYVLRTSMRSLEEVALGHGLVRCQRSYYVNPQHVKVLRKDVGGLLFADLDVEGLPSIPVSKRYQDALAKLL